MPQTINPKVEVQKILGREFNGIESVLISHYMKGGMVNPIDLARTLIERHIMNEQAQVDAYTVRVSALKIQLEKINRL